MPIFEKLDRSYDIVFCMDATGSLQVQFFADFIHEFSYTFYSHLASIFEDSFYLRVKIIAFKDYKYDKDPMVESPFFVLSDDKSDQSNELFNFIDQIELRGGGDLPENSLEALALAIKSDWSKECAIKRYITVLFTDAPAKPLGQSYDNLDYPKDMPSSLEELHQLWNDFDKRSKRLFLIAPDENPWNQMVDWDKVLYVENESFFNDFSVEGFVEMLTKF